MAGPFELWNGMRGVVETLCEFCCYFKVQGAYTEVAQCIQCMLLHENECVTSQSCDFVAFQKGGFASAGNRCGGRTGDIGVCSVCKGEGCTRCGEVCSRSGGMCSLMLGVVVGTREQERVGLMLWSSWALCTHSAMLIPGARWCSGNTPCRPPQ